MNLVEMLHHVSFDFGFNLLSDDKASEVASSGILRKRNHLSLSDRVGFIIETGNYPSSRGYLGFWKIKRLGVFLLPPG